MNLNICAPVDLYDQTLSVFSSLDKSGYNLNGTDVILEDRQKDIYNKFGNKTCQSY